ncbi:hypothetical protein [Micromonospora echinofusca]|uniref:hypothetical protein n=1 Tax=Micromonospora echinofusca TaxID=47858 RepID=UPI0027DBECD1|nr:hypothetical protein [Micromonospora echinofusca]
MTISSYLLILFAVLQVITLIVGLTVLSTMQEVFRDAYAGTSLEGAETIATVSGIGAAVVGLLLAIGFVVLAVLNNRGKNVSRIITWVLGGIALCCTGVGLAGNALNGMMSGQTGGDVPSQQEINRRLDAALPSWYEPVSNLLTVLALLALLVALILLALPASNEFFRKPQTVWEPPVPGANYPGYPSTGTPGYPQHGTPGYPQSGAPGYPPTPGQPGYPQQEPPSGGPGYPPPGGDNPPGDRPGPSAPPPTS